MCACVCVCVCVHVCVCMCLVPDEDTLAVAPPPEGPVALVGDGVDVGLDGPQVLAGVAVHGGGAVELRDGLVRVHRCQDGPDVRLGDKGSW